MPAPQTDPWEDVAKEYHSGGGTTPQSTSPSERDEDWKLFTPQGSQKSIGGPPSNAQRFAGAFFPSFESAPPGTSDWETFKNIVGNVYAPPLGHTGNKALDYLNMVPAIGPFASQIGSDILQRHLPELGGHLSSGALMALGMPGSENPPRTASILREGATVRNGAGAVGIARDFLAKKALSSILPPGASGPALSILKQMFGGPAEEPFDIFAREAPKMGAPQPVLGPAPRSAAGWQGMAPPTIANPPGFSGLPGELPSGRQVGGPQNVGPVPSGPASVLPTDLLDKFAQGSGKYKRFADIPADAPVRERIIREVQKITGEEMSNRLNQVIKLTPESATPPITPPPTENPMAGPPTNPFPEHPEAMIHARLGVAMKDAKDMAIAQRLKSLGLNPEEMSVDDLAPHYKALGYKAPGKSGGQYARPAELGREQLIRMFKSLGPPTP